MADAANPEKIRKDLTENPFVSQFAQEGAKLLELTNRPNIITIEQFLPFVELFRVDKERQKSDNQYRTYLSELYLRYIRELDINRHEVTYVVESKEKQDIVVALDRIFTRISDDRIPDGPNVRDNIPALALSNPRVSRESVMLDASFQDVVKSNASKEQQDVFLRNKMESALVTKLFTELNLSPEKRAELMGEKTSDSVTSVSSNDFPDVTLIDED